MVKTVLSLETGVQLSTMALMLAQEDSPLHQAGDKQTRLRHLR